MESAIFEDQAVVTLPREAQANNSQWMTPFLLGGSYLHSLKTVSDSNNPKYIESNVNAWLPTFRANLSLPSQARAVLDMDLLLSGDWTEDASEQWELPLIKSELARIAHESKSSHIVALAGNLKDTLPANFEALVKQFKNIPEKNIESYSAWYKQYQPYLIMGLNLSDASSAATQLSSRLKYFTSRNPVSATHDLFDDEMRAYVFNAIKRSSERY
jgi:hypothetical protein